MTKPIRAARRAMAVAAISALLVGCISVFPKEAPAQLYRFGDTAPERANAVGAAQARFTVRIVPTSFDRAAVGDRILTTTGDQAAYIKGARWLTPAGSMFEEAVVRAFDADGGSARLLAPGEAAHIDYVLKLDVRTFEARYGGDPKAAPTVVVEIYAAISRAADRDAVSERLFETRAPASDNRVGAIAGAFDQAVGKGLGELVAWVDAKGAS